MAFTAPTEDIEVVGPYTSYDFTASGTITRGQAVYLNAPGYCLEGTDNKTGIGIAMYSRTKGQKIAVLGPGNIVRARQSGTSATIGCPMKCTVEGYVISGNSDGKQGYEFATCIEPASAAAGECKILIH